MGGRSSKVQPDNTQEELRKQEERQKREQEQLEKRKREGTGFRSTILTSLANPGQPKNTTGS